jgi:hypothetical protein
MPLKSKGPFHGRVQDLGELSLQIVQLLERVSVSHLLLERHVLLSHAALDQTQNAVRLVAHKQLRNLPDNISLARGAVSSIARLKHLDHAIDLSTVIRQQGKLLRHCHDQFVLSSTKSGIAHAGSVCVFPSVHLKVLDDFQNAIFVVALRLARKAKAERPPCS